MITSVDVVSREIPYADAFPTSYDDPSPTQHVFVRIRTVDETGYGEGSALKWFTGDTADTMASIVRSEFAPAIEGESVPAALGACRDLTDRLPGNPGASAGVEMALLDLRAKQLGIQLRELLGQHRRGSIPLAFASGALPAETVASNVVNAFESGFRTFKIKVTSDLDSSAARINAVTRELSKRADPNEVFVRADANTGWESYELASRAIDRIERPAFIEYYEQPVAADAVGDLRSLRTDRGVPVFADEAIHDTTEVRELTREPSAVSGFCAKLAKAGSLVEIVRMGELAANAGVPVTLISAFETSLGVAANLHIASVLPAISSAAELGANLIAEDPVGTSISRAPDTPVPEGPGLGVELNDVLFD